MDSEGGGLADVVLVSLGHVDIDPEVLAGSGGSLREALGGRAVDDRIGECAPRLPQTGWRLVHRSPRHDGRGGSEVFAAPSGQSPAGGWAVATVSAPRDDGVGILSADPGPVRVFPGRVNRRAALSLLWPDDLVAPAGSIPELTIHLRNDADQVWLNEIGDSSHVRGWLVDAEGRRLEASSWFAFGGVSTLPVLQPGEVVVLPVTMASFDYLSLSPGTYQLEAVAVALDLRSAPGLVLLT